VRNRTRLLLRGGLSGVVVASAITILLLPEAASDPRSNTSPTFSNEFHSKHRGPAGDGRRPANKASVWANPKRINVPVGRLIIPAIGIDVPFRMGARDEIIQLGPGLLPGTPLPGDVGNAVLAGHRTTYTHPFEDLDLLRRGDVIATRVFGNPRTVFKVTKKTVLPESEYADFVLRQPASNIRMVTLFACTPKGFRSHRIIVQATASRIRREAQHTSRGVKSKVRLLERS
jgi:LPXTG-site transpeptidase (sortase) family protein